MKKSMIFALAAIILAASCTLIEADGTFVNEESAAFYLGAEINLTKTVLGDRDGSTYPIEWQAGDKINVNGLVSDALAAGNIKDGKYATFGFASALEGTLNAVSPASAYVSDGVVNLPQDQVYTAGSYDPAAAILLGTGTASVSMTCAVAFLKFDVKSTEGIKKIQVGGLAREALSGQFTTGDYATISPKTGSTAGFVNVSSETPVTEGSMILTIPAQKYANGLLLMITDAGDNTVTKKSTAEFTAEAGKMYSTSIDLAPAGKDAIEFSTAPENGAAISIDHSKGLYDEAIAISWSAEVVGAEYNVAMSLSSDMSDALGVASGSSTSLSLDNKTLNNLMSKLGKEFSSDVTVYYQVKAGDSVNPSEIRNVVVSTEFGSFTDSRDNEVYPVTKVGDKYWMAENMRAVKYSDGTALEAMGTYDFIPYTDGYLGKRAGVYYTYAHAVRGNCDGHWFSIPYPDASVILQGICPEGWHVANNNDFVDAVKAAATALGTSYSDDFFSMNSWPTVASAFRLGADFPQLASGYDYNNELGLYFIPAAFYQENGDRAAAPYDYGYETLLWSATMRTSDSCWDAFVFQSNQWNNLAFAGSRGAHPVGGWAAQLPARCVKNY